MVGTFAGPGIFRTRILWEDDVALDKPVSDSARKGALKKRSQPKAAHGEASAWTWRNRKSGGFMAVKVKKRAATKTAAKKR